MNNPLIFLKNKLKNKKTVAEKLPNTFTINNRQITIVPATYDEVLEVVFLLLPYLKMVRVVKEEHKSNLDPVIFFDIVENLILQLRRQDINKILQIFLKQDEEFVSKITADDLVKLAPIIIRVNNLIEIMFLMRNLGAFE
jgi:hypothetical protein